MDSESVRTLMSYVPRGRTMSQLGKTPIGGSSAIALAAWEVAGSCCSPPCWPVTTSGQLTAISGTAVSYLLSRSFTICFSSL